MTASFSSETASAINEAWDVNAAESSMERWLSLCEREDWHDDPANHRVLALLFGASWYFTRFVFFQGKDIAGYFDSTRQPDFSMQGILQRLHEIPRTDDLELEFEQLRINKNTIMLQIFLGSLRGQLDQEQQEVALTHLAEATLQTSLDLLIGETVDSAAELAVLAMGRMAGGEMNYGSDLDLIFLYDRDSGQEQGDLIRKIQSLLRFIALPSAHGILYEIDMRLRPHGTSGTLISPASYFIEYHQGEREIWERQMMTRCRPVLDTSGLATRSLETVEPHIYTVFDEGQLREQVISMRYRVQKELGSPQGKLEIKRGVGGVMDIDFLCHFLQLKYGHNEPAMQTASTREAIRQSAALGHISGSQRDRLLAAYDYLKRIESVLRVKDLKSISAFSASAGEDVRLARAMGYMDADTATAGERFLEEYRSVTTDVRQQFESIVGPVIAG